MKAAPASEDPHLPGARSESHTRTHPGVPAQAATPARPAEPRASGHPGPTTDPATTGEHGRTGEREPATTGEPGRTGGDGRPAEATRAEATRAEAPTGPAEPTEATGPAEATGSNGPDGPGEPAEPADLAALAARHGLTVSGRRPDLPEYVRQLWRRRHFILAFSRAKLTAQYSQAKLGQLWQVATPLLNALVFFLIFGLVLRAGRGMPLDVYIPFLITGVFVFTFTQSCVQTGVRAVSGNLGLVRALHFPRAALPLALSLQQLHQLLYSMVVVALFAVGSGNVPSLSWLLVVPALLLQSVFNTGLAMAVARLGSKLPDLAQLTPFVLRTWMYGSGVMFSIPLMLQDRPDWLVNLLQWNPAAVYMDLVRFALIDAYGAENLLPHVWAVALGWALLVGVLGFVYFWKAEEQYGRE